MMKINYFGEIADITNKSSDELTTNVTTVFELIEYLKSNYKIEVDDMHIAINHNIVSKSENTPINEGDEIAVLSAFAGG